MEWLLTYENEIQLEYIKQFQECLSLLKGDTVIMLKSKGEFDASYQFDQFLFISAKQQQIHMQYFQGLLIIMKQIF